MRMASRLFGIHHYTLIPKSRCSRFWNKCSAEEMMEVMAGQTENPAEESVETIDNGSAVTGEERLQDKELIATLSVAWVESYSAAQRVCG